MTLFLLDFLMATILADNLLLSLIIKNKSFKIPCGGKVFFRTHLSSPEKILFSQEFNSKGGDRV